LLDACERGAAHRPTAGSGLGLAIVQRIARRMAARCGSNLSARP
jgi:signal transduction histidine kinase